MFGQLNEDPYSALLTLWAVIQAVLSASKDKLGNLLMQLAVKRINARLHDLTEAAIWEIPSKALKLFEIFPVPD
jgi:hypothetical protein